jgi:DNA polymerase I-like protein with 3'-5' exonuclease and polymerase domains
VFKQYEDVKSTIIWTEEDLQSALAFIAAQDLLGFDVETDGVNPRKNKTIGIGVADLHEGYYLPLFGYNKQDDKLEPVHERDFIMRFLNALKGKKLLAFNGAFEAGFCQEDLSWDFIENFYSDQMLMLHLLDENKYNYGLKDNAEQEWGEVATEAQRQMLASVAANGGTEKEYFKSDVQPLGHYCVWDCALTVGLYLRDLPKLKQQGLDKFFFEDETMPAYKYAVIPMELNGIRLDMPLLESALSEIRTDLTNLNSEILQEISPLLQEFNSWFYNNEYPPKRTGPFAQAVVDLFAPDSLPRTATGSYSFAAKAVEDMPESFVKQWLLEKQLLSASQIRLTQLKLHNNQPTFNLLSGDHLKRLFFEKLKENPLSRTKPTNRFPDGSAQVDDKFLELMAKKYEWAAKLQTYRRLTKIHGTYFERIYNESETGRFYPSYFCHRTKTGRQSGDFQQLPRPLSPEDESNEMIRKHNNKIRALFIADEGYKFLDADYNSLEVVVFADDSGDEGLLNIIRQDKDFYSEIAIGAQKLGNLYSSDKSAPNFLKKHRPDIRQSAKPYALGFRYGEEPYKLHMETGWPKEECDAIYNNYFTAFPGLKQKMDYYIHEVCTKGYVTSKAGRRRRQYQAVRIYQEHGLGILNSLELWKKYNEEPALYARMKKLRKDFKSIINSSLNFPIQSMAASIVSRAAWKLALWLKENCPSAKLVASIHDQLICHCPEEHLEYVKANMRRIMEETTKLSVPLIADPAISENMRDGH